MLWLLNPWTNFNLVFNFVASHDIIFFFHGLQMSKMALTIDLTVGAATVKYQNCEKSPETRAAVK